MFLVQSTPYSLTELGADSGRAVLCVIRPKLMLAGGEHTHTCQ